MKKNKIFNELKSILEKKASFYKLKKEDMEDLIQETYLVIYENLDKYVDKNKFDAWAKKIMENLFIDDYHKRVKEFTMIDPNQFIMKWIHRTGKTIRLRKKNMNSRNSIIP
ncbi:MAG: hypothetical protein LIP06_01965 [Tannerellaceae bacterium]|nr:hypothetical protein [Tannerellaceae bacterium]